MLLTATDKMQMLLTDLLIATDRYTHGLAALWLQWICREFSPQNPRWAPKCPLAVQAGYCPSRCHLFRVLNLSRAETRFPGVSHRWPSPWCMCRSSLKRHWNYLSQLRSFKKIVMVSVTSAKIAICWDREMKTFDVRWWSGLRHTTVI